MADSAEAASIPTLVPMIVLEEESRCNLFDQRDYHYEIARIAKDTGLYPWDMTDDPRQDANLLSFTVRLTKVAQHLASAKESDLRLLQAIQLVSQVHEQVVRVQQRSGVDPSVAMDKIAARLDDLTALTRDMLLRTERRTYRPMCRLMVASRDNQLNYRAAEASNRLAAVTRRDSADMRVIAAVTLIFLPGTFVATLFSTSFFDFSPKEPRRVVSKRVWLYWVIAIALTAVVLVAWLVTSRVMHKRHGSPVLATEAPERRKSLESEDNDHGSVLGRTEVSEEAGRAGGVETAGGAEIGPAMLGAQRGDITGSSGPTDGQEKVCGDGSEAVAANALGSASTEILSGHPAPKGLDSKDVVQLQDQYVTAAGRVDGMAHAPLLSLRRLAERVGQRPHALHATVDAV
ncbi:hypothetical protein LTR36_001663 [Oleoguttula mirabilis]|uniref:Uncharacterized protein n=1 Tax=Oleoguttula mirabilis TaxID=1507867 RepID=A0AAV9JPI3_9PEZI|nr:hypothetical protein LTR36_001663 [Oleoguttula mirabilis]